MTGRSIFALLCALSLPVAAHAASCELGKLVELPVTMSGLQPVVDGQINGHPEQFLLDSGAFFSSLAPALAKEMNLKLEPLPPNMRVMAIGGTVEMSVTRVKQFTLGTIPLPNVQFLVGGTDVGTGGIMGQNVLQIADDEYDFANGVFRIIKPQHCSKAILAYWASAGTAYSRMDIDSRAGQTFGATKGYAYLNGKKIRVQFDTGAATSYLALRAAEHVGFKTDGPGVSPAGNSGGLGRRAVRTWVGPFQSFKIGDEEVRNIRLRVGDTALGDVDMLVGADFFLSHHVYVSNEQSKLYFTYNGGPVFNLKTILSRAATELPNAVASTAPGAAAATPATPSGNASGAAAPAPTTPSGNAPGAAANVPGEPSDAEGFSRRGAASASRGDLAHAIADLTKATQLAPTEPRYFVQLGDARLSNRQPALAMANYDEALHLKPDLVAALLSRAQLRVESRDFAAAAADLDTIDGLTPKEDVIRIQLGALYTRIGAFDKAVNQLDRWIDARGDTGRTPQALELRCRARGLWDKDVDKALKDCNSALRLSPESAEVLDARAIVRIRMHDYDHAIADLDVVLKAQPRNAGAMYLRGVAKLKKGQTAAGDEDMTAAKMRFPGVVDDAQRYGLTP
ncbi:MAG TPA: aspartyl protease family protein [Steroidobacteraceae bacterium]|jgi:tetratricopeptide (TPR) repeat protein